MHAYRERERERERGRERERERQREREREKEGERERKKKEGERPMQWDPFGRDLPRPVPGEPLGVLHSARGRVTKRGASRVAKNPWSLAHTHYIYIYIHIVCYSIHISMHMYIPYTYINRHIYIYIFCISQSYIKYFEHATRVTNITVPYWEFLLTGGGPVFGPLYEGSCSLGPH